ncbi:MAG: hypothetical protein DRJ67_10780 [Thermoprotei archaeon]|nr:MAG: hypothetical protein DRJ67_10780 [Thermoprotei archaeon]
MRWSWRNEPIEKHVGGMLARWKAYKRVYEAPLARLYRGLGSVDDMMKCALIMHDVGKLVPRYQKFLRGEARLGDYRHEVVSAAITAITFKHRPWRIHVSAAILLSHEPILMGQVGRVGERYLTLTSVERILRLAGDGELVKLEDDGVEAINSLLEREGFEERVAREYGVDECLEVLKETVVATSIAGNRLLERLRVAALIHVLTVIDSITANESREDDEGGTFVTRHARQAEVVEVMGYGGV